ncbi:hypothetical protein C8R46DRAFT_1108861 [Mycena filopes]|nr:hypothetical protein C8R46DRAFT_1108861 [Mycena filopes]
MMIWRCVWLFLRSSFISLRNHLPSLSIIARISHAPSPSIHSYFTPLLPCVSSPLYTAGVVLISSLPDPASDIHTIHLLSTPNPYPHPHPAPTYHRTYPCRRRRHLLLRSSYPCILLPSFDEIVSPFCAFVVPYYSSFTFLPPHPFLSRPSYNFLLYLLPPLPLITRFIRHPSTPPSSPCTLPHPSSFPVPSAPAPTFFFHLPSILPAPPSHLRR